MHIVTPPHVCMAAYSSIVVVRLSFAASRHCLDHQKEDLCVLVYGTFFLLCFAPLITSRRTQHGSR